MQRKKRFNPGDRIYTRVILQGRQVAEYVFDCVSGMSELITALRYRTRELRGLASIYVRNMTAGWSMEQPLMLYPGRYPQGNSPQSGATHPAPAPAAYRRYMDY